MNFYRGLMSLSLVLLLSACQSAYYGAMEKLGVHKRDILVSRVEKVRDAEEEAQEQFQSALEQLIAVTGFEGGELQSVYEALQDEYDGSVVAAENVQARIEEIESVAEALFDEWQDEIGQYQNAQFKRDSQHKLNATKKRYARLVKSLHKSADKMAPILDTLRDNVLYLKHNLNAKALGAIKVESKRIQKDIQLLIEQMKIAIQESDDFIKSMGE